MGIFGRFEKRSLADIQENANWNLLTEPPNYRVDEKEALSDSAVDFCVSSIADDLAGLPLDLFGTENGKRVELTKPSWMVQPNPNETRQDTFKTTWLSALLSGNAFWLLMRDDAGELQQIEVLNPNRVGIYIENGTVKYTIDEDKKLNGQEIINGQNILHIKNKALPGEYWGLSPIGLHRRTINASIKSEELSTEMFNKGMMTSAAVVYPNKLDPDEAARVSKQLQTNNSVKGNTGKVMVLSGDPKVMQLQISPADAQFLESKKYNAIQVARIFKFPPYKLDPSVTTTWGKGIQEQNQNYVDTTLKSWIDILEAVINTYLLEPGQYVKFNLDAILRGDIEARYDSYGKAIYAGFMTPNEARSLEDMEITEDGDSLQIPLSQGNRNLQDEKLALQIEEQKLKNALLRKQLNAEEGGTGGKE